MLNTNMCYYNQNTFEIEDKTSGKQQPTMSRVLEFETRLQVK